MRFSAQRKIRSFSNLVPQRSIGVTFKDGSDGLFPYVWLRDCSLDSKTYTITPAMKGRLHFMRNFDVNVQPLDISLDKNGNCLIIKWPENVISRYEQRWLKSRCPANEKVRLLRRKFYLGLECVRNWNRQQIEGRNFRFSREEFLNDDRVLHDFLLAVCTDGIALLEGTEQDPNNSQLFKKIVQRIGFLQRNHFGEIFEVIPKANASNMAYAGAEELPYHTDFPSLSDPPQLQMLHMANRAECGGGLSMFVDGFHIAELMAQKYPEHFQLLSTIPLEFVEEGFDVHKLMDGSEERFDYDLVARHKTIKLNGDSVLWANTRLLHARTGYAVVGEAARERRVIGCYFGWDAVKSRVRMLRDVLELAPNQNTL
uniref:TauD domain-containing protein n=1 Tax=Globodera pallida TaxID=36090 RepID=A0A183C9E7_GLOPA